MSDEAATTARQVLDRVLDARFHRQLLTLALAIVRDPTVAEEVVQDVYVAVIGGRSTLGVASDPGAYLRTCVRNETRRRAGQLRRGSARTAEVDQGRIECRRPPVSENYLAYKEIPTRLPRHLRPVYGLWRWGMTQEEIAAELGYSRPTVKRRWSELLARLEHLVAVPEKL